MVRPRWTGILPMLVFAASSASARETINVVVEFNAPPGCSDRETFASGLKSRSSLLRITETNEHVWVVGVRLTPKDRGVHGELRLTDEHGESELRAVDGVDCAEVVEALSFTAALAIERTVERSEAGSSSPAASGSTADAASNGGTVATPSGGTPTPPSAATPSTKQEENLHQLQLSAPDVGPSDMTRVGLIAFATQRVAPQTSFGLSLSLSRQFVLREGLASEVALGAVYVPGDALQPKGEVRVSYLGATLQGCPVAWTTAQTLSLSACAVLELTRLTVTDRAVDVSLPSKRLTGFVGGLGRGRLRLARHVELALEFGVLTPLAARRYLTNSPGTEVGHSQTLAWQAGIGWLFGW